MNGDLTRMGRKLVVSSSVEGLPEQARIQRVSFPFADVAGPVDVSAVIALAHEEAAAAAFAYRCTAPDGSSAPLLLAADSTEGRRLVLEHALVMCAEAERDAAQAVASAAGLRREHDWSERALARVRPVLREHGLDGLVPAFVLAPAPGMRLSTVNPVRQRVPAFSSHLREVRVLTDPARGVPGEALGLLTASLFRVGGGEPLFVSRTPASYAHPFVSLRVPEDAGAADDLWIEIGWEGAAAHAPFLLLAPDTLGPEARARVGEAEAPAPLAMELLSGFPGVEPPPPPFSLRHSPADDAGWRAIAIGAVASGELLHPSPDGLPYALTAVEPARNALMVHPAYPPSETWVRLPGLLPAGVVELAAQADLVDGAYGAVEFHLGVEPLRDGAPPLFTPPGSVAWARESPGGSSIIQHRLQEPLREAASILLATRMAPEVEHNWSARARFSRLRFRSS